MESAALVKLSDIQTVPSNVCEKGNQNVDGSCIQGGYMMPKSMSGTYLPQFGKQYSMGCVATPVYYLPYVPYQTNQVSGHNFASLSSIAQGTKLLRNYPP